VTTVFRKRNNHRAALPPSQPAFRLAQDITVDFDAHEYEVKGTRVPMTPRESQLLSPLVEKYRTSRRGVVTTSFLVEQMMPGCKDNAEPEQSIAQTASNIRRKWDETPRSPRFLTSIRGIGYRLQPEPGYGDEVHHDAEQPKLNKT
jgi:DNA-binding response OmpR family regulator